MSAHDVLIIDRIIKEGDRLNSFNAVLASIEKPGPYTEWLERQRPALAKIREEDRG